MARDLTHAIAALKTHQLENRGTTTSALFAADPQRFAKFHVAIDGIVFD